MGRVNRVENLVAVVKNGNDSPSSSSLVVGKPTVAADNTNDPPCRIHFDSGQDPFECDLIVGCDGIHSPIRKQIVGDDMQFLNLMVILGIFDTTVNGNTLNLCVDVFSNI